MTRICAAVDRTRRTSLVEYNWGLFTNGVEGASGEKYVDDDASYEDQSSLAGGVLRACYRVSGAALARRRESERIQRMLRQERHTRLRLRLRLRSRLDAANSLATISAAVSALACNQVRWILAIPSPVVRCYPSPSCSGRH